MLWHQALENYHEPEKFRANLNACIEALRNATFVLQKEKAAVPEFDTWYGGWQQKLRDDKTARWLNEARVTVVHQGDLDTYSFAEVRLVGWRDELVSAIQVPIGTPLRLILQNPTLLQLLNESTENRWPDDAALVIERRWSTKDLEGREILSALADVYGLAAAIVLDAHSQVGYLSCIACDTPHPDFPSTYDRTGTLRCMVASVESRTQRLNRSTDQPLIPVRDAVPDDVGADEVLSRYGADDGFVLSEIERHDPVAIAKRVQHIAKHIVRRDKHHERMMFIRDGRGRWSQIILLAKDQTEKHILMQMAAQFIEMRGCDAIVEVGEVWTAELSEISLRFSGNLEKAPGRGEALAVMLATRDGISREYITPIVRGRFGGIKLGDTVETADEPFYHLAPIINVWRKQRRYRTADGTLSPVWEPDLLDLCPCGGEKVYGECCRPSIVNRSQPDNIREKVEQAIATENLELAEKTARAAVAQYVIWIRQHTAPTMHVAPELHEEIVSIDVLALEAHVTVMIRVLSAVGKSELIVPHLQRLRRLVFVPQIAMRLTALCSKWLFDAGRSEEAVLELNALGTFANVKDSSALSLMARHLDLTEQEKEEVLKNAIKVAACEEEKYLAQLNMASHLLRRGKVDEALPFVQSVVKETDGDLSSSERSAALILRWRLTGSEETFQTAFVEMTRSDVAADVYRNGIYLIDMGKYSEAETLLSNYIQSGDVEAKLLIVDARMRSGARESASELFSSIRYEDVPISLRFAYAYTMSLLVLVGGAESRRNDAIALLEDESHGGGELAEHGKSLLMALKRPG